MANRQTQKEGTTPTNFPDTISGEAPGQHSFLLQAMFELRGAFGKVEQSVQSLEKIATDLNTKLDDVRHQMSFMKGAMWAIGGIFALLVFILTLFFTGKLGITINPAK